MFLDALIFLVVGIGITVLGFFVISKFEVSGIKKFELLVSYLGGISVILVIYNLYITIQSNDRIEKNRIAYNTIENIQKNYLAPQQELLDLYPEGYFLYASMNQDTDLQNYAPVKFDPVERRQVEVYASLRIFQAMEDFLSTAAYDLTGNYVWICNFLMWMQSPILQHNWSKLRFNYALDTQELVERIIVQANHLVELRKEKQKLSSDDYQSIAKNMVIHYR